MTDIPLTTDAAELPDGEYAIVELLGHRTLIGRIAEVERFGTKLLQIEPIYRGELLPPVFHHGSSLYALTPCSREVANGRGATQDYQLPTPVRARLEPTLLSDQTNPTTDADYEEVDEEELPI